MGLGNARVLWHFRDFLRMSKVGILCDWALQGYSADGLYRDTLRLGTARILCGSILCAGNSRDTLRLGNVGTLCG